MPLIPYTHPQQKVIAIDFDGTLCVNKYPDIGDPIQRAIQLVKREKEKGSVIILWTCRQGEHLTAAVDWCKRQGIIFDYVNENTHENIARYGGDTRKICADVYIDDKAADINSLAFGGGYEKR
jgi:trehalose-6-phosphatase